MILEVGVVKVSGEQAKSFLHALVSSDLEQLAKGKSQTSLLLEPSGKLVSAFWIFCIDDTNYLLVCPLDTKESLLEGLKRLLIRTNAEVVDISSDYLAIVDLIKPQTDREIVVDNNYMGNAEFALSLKLGGDLKEKVSDPKLHETLRISSGAVSVKDLQGGVIPQEANLDIESVSFSKGCFLGQELVCRIDSRQSSTPFSFYEFRSEQKLPKIEGELELYIDDEFAGKASSFIDDTEQIDEALTNYKGDVKAIFRLQRKFVQFLENDQFDGRLELLDSAKPATRIKVSGYSKVSGVFSL